MVFFLKEASKIFYLFFSQNKQVGCVCGDNQFLWFHLLLFQNTVENSFKKAPAGWWLMAGADLF
jgi:hypothetical protein